MRHYRVGSHGPVTVRLETCHFKVERRTARDAGSDERSRVVAPTNPLAAAHRWTSEDPVRALMLQPGEFAVVSSAQTCAMAEALAVSSRSRDLVVLDPDHRLVGVASRWDLARASTSALVTECMTSDVLTISPDATLGEAVAAMNTFRFCCLPVVDETDAVLGLLTRCRLRAAGVPSGLVGPERCARCHAERTPLDEDELCPRCSSAIDWLPNVVSDGEPD